MADSVILGAGTFAVEVLEAAELSGITVRGFLVTPEFARSGLLEGLPVHTVANVPWAPADVAIVAGIVSTKRRQFVERMIGHGFNFVAIRHPSATVSPRAVAAPGSMIGAGAIVAARASVGPHVIRTAAPISATMSASARIATVGPGAVVAGGAQIESRAWIGVGAIVRDRATVGEGAVVGAGAVVVKPVPAHTLVIGAPAEVVREGVDGY